MQPKDFFIQNSVLDAATLKQRAELYARKQEKEEIKGEIKEFLCFRVGEEKYLAEIHAVHEVLTPARISKLPFQKQGMVGMMNVRGNAVLILDPGALLNAAGVSDKKTSKILLIKNAAEQTGILVAEVYGECRLDSGEMQPPVSTIKGASLDFIRGLFQKEGEPYVWLEVEKIIKHISNQWAPK